MGENARRRESGKPETEKIKVYGKRGTIRLGKMVQEETTHFSVWLCSAYQLGLANVCKCENGTLVWCCCIHLDK